MLRVLVRKLGRGPAAGLGSVGVEVSQANLTHRGHVVIASHQDVVHTQNCVQTSIGIGPVPHSVTQAPYLIDNPVLPGVGQNGAEGLQVAVDVGEYGYSHDPFVLPLCRMVNIAYFPCGPDWVKI